MTPSDTAHPEGEMKDVFERPFDGYMDPRLQVARVITRREAEAILEHSGDLVAALSTPPSRPQGEEGRGGIYVASRASVLERGQMWRDCRDRGAPIISTWIDEDGPNDTAALDELWTRILREVTGASGLVLYVEPSDFPLKGAFVEIGMALAANVPITIVAPGVEITGRNQRPFGSWIKHPLVSFADAVEQALSALSNQGKPSS
jgi:hypothetical protein